MSQNDDHSGHDRGKEDQDKKRYQIQIDKDHHAVEQPQPTGRTLLQLAGKNPPEGYALYLKPRGGGAPVRIELDETVDLREPGVERFVTLPLDQTEGLGSDRREFSLPAEDVEWLEGLGLRYELVREGAVLRVVVYGFRVPPGYGRDSVDVNVRIATGYPDTEIDMAYFHPPLGRADRRPIRCICAEAFDGKTWQRWSRHRTAANPWRPGLDNLSTHFALIESWLVRELAKA